MQQGNSVLPAPPMSHPLPPASELIISNQESVLDDLLGNEIQPGAGILADLLDSLQEENHTPESNSIFNNTTEKLNEPKNSNVQAKAALAQTKLNFHSSETDLKLSVPMNKRQTNTADSDIE